MGLDLFPRKRAGSILVIGHEPRVELGLYRRMQGHLIVGRPSRSRSIKSRSLTRRQLMDVLLGNLHTATLANI